MRKGGAAERVNLAACGEVSDTELATTREWGYDHKGLYHGHYLENNYVAAKEDLAQRSGLVEKHRLFTDEQLTEIYRTADEALDNDIELSGETVSALRSICNQIEYSLPDARDRIAAAAQASEHTQSQQFNMWHSKSGGIF